MNKKSLLLLLFVVMFSSFVFADAGMKVPPGYTAVYSCCNASEINYSSGPSISCCDSMPNVEECKLCYAQKTNELEQKARQSRPFKLIITLLLIVFTSAIYMADLIFLADILTLLINKKGFLSKKIRIIFLILFILSLIYLLFLIAQTRIMY